MQAADDGQAGHDADRAAIREVSEGLIKAFGAGDAKALADLWTAEGEFIADDGTSVRGRSALGESLHSSSCLGFLIATPGTCRLLRYLIGGWRRTAAEQKRC